MPILQQSVKETSLSLTLVKASHRFSYYGDSFVVPTRYFATRYPHSFPPNIVTSIPNYISPYNAETLEWFQQVAKVWPAFADRSDFEFHWPKLRDSSVAIAAIERIRSVTMLKLSCFDVIISHFQAHHRLNLLLDPEMAKNDKEIRAIALQLQKRREFAFARFTSRDTYEALFNVRIIDVTYHD